jgi:hypothetical protein
MNADADASRRLYVIKDIFANSLRIGRGRHDPSCNAGCDESVTAESGIMADGNTAICEGDVN